MTLYPYHKRIVTNATTNVLSESCLLAQVIISCSNAGATWTLRIQDKAASPAIIVPGFTLSVPTITGEPIIITFKDFQPLMEGGIDIVTATGSPLGVVDVWLHIAAGP